MDACNDIDINNRRTRINIATSCISTIFLCTWVAFHPNIPGPDEPKWKVIRRRVGCMIGGLLAPEIYVLLSARQFIAARAVANASRKWGWTLTHGFFALMGGFMIYDGETADKIGFYDPLVIGFARDFSSLEALEHRSVAQHPNWPAQPFQHSLDTLRFIAFNLTTFEATHPQVKLKTDPSIFQCLEQVGWYSGYLTTDEFKIILSDYLESRNKRQLLEETLIFLKAFEHDTTVFTLGESETDYPNSTEVADRTNESISNHIPNPPIANLELRKLARVPRISEQDIQDKSKSDILTKTIALFQVTWFILQLGARYHENLAITELEIFTLAFCVLNFATYALWWKKPFAVDRGYAIRWRDNDWEVIAPPFIERSQDPWYQWCLDLMLGVIKGCHQVSLVGVETHGDPSLPPPSVETTSPSSRQSQPLRYLWKKVKHSLSSLWAGIGHVIEVVFFRLTRGETTLLDSGKRVSTFSPTMMKLEGSNAFIYYLSGCFLILVFGSIHFLAWSLGPTNTDKLIWRICSICVAVLPMIVFLLEKCGDFVDCVDNKVVKTIASTSVRIFLTTPLFYILARIGLLVLLVRSLIYCPPSALQAVSWSQLVPHV